MGRFLARELLLDVGLVDTVTGVLEVFPPIPPNPLVEPSVSHFWHGKPLEDPETMASFNPPPAIHEDRLARAQLFYALDPVAEPFGPGPDRFHTVALFGVLFTGGVAQEWGYDTGLEREALIGNFTLPAFSAPTFPFQAVARWIVTVYCENDNPGVTLFQPYSLTWRESR